MPASVVAAELGLSVYTIRRWIEAGTLKGGRVRGRWYASRRALAAIRTALTGI